MGLPMNLMLHHDTEAGTNNPIDGDVLAGIELQVMNSGMAIWSPKACRFSISIRRSRRIRGYGAESA